MKKEHAGNPLTHAHSLFFIVFVTFLEPRKGENLNTKAVVVADGGKLINTREWKTVGL